MGKKIKGLSARALGLLILTIVCVIIILAVLFKYELSDFFKRFLNKGFCGDGHCGPDETWSESETEKIYCPADCSRPCFIQAMCVNGEFVDMGSISLGTVEDKTATAEVCSHSDLMSDLEDYFRFSVDDEGHVFVTYRPEVYTSHETSEYSCIPPKFEVFSGGCDVGKVGGKESLMSCEAITFDFHSGAGETYYIHVFPAMLDELESTVQDTSPSLIQVYLEEEGVVCKSCVNAGKEWCKLGETGKCLNSCNIWWNCNGGMCIKDDSSYCTPTPPGECGFLGVDDCDDNPWCKYCFKCEGKKVSQWEYDVMGRCVGKDTNCGYACRPPSCDAECIFDYECGTDRVCNAETCTCEDGYCCSCVDPYPTSFCTSVDECPVTCTIGLPCPHSNECIPEPD